MLASTPLLRVEYGKDVLAGHEALLHVSQLQVVQRQHVLLLFLLLKHPQTSKSKSESKLMTRFLSIPQKNASTVPSAVLPPHLCTRTETQQSGQTSSPWTLLS